jgi:Domain of unknown function (DU1801)
MEMFRETSAAASPEAYLEAIDEGQQADVRALDAIIRATAPGLDRRVESGMLAYGRYTYRYASGRSGPSFAIGLAARKRYISLYVMATDGERYVAETYRDRLPAADIGRSCVRFKRLADLDRDALVELVRAGATLDGRDVVAG